jgi:Na+/proline symporter
MKPLHILFLIVGYFSVLILISFITGRKATNDTFFKANNSSPWYLVAFGMIGASLSGVTFISVPGWVENQSMSYMQMVFGYIVGYAVIGLVLLPLYYQLNLTSIYTYLEDRFGRYSYKTGASFFLLSRTIGAAFRLFLVANVLQLLLFDEFGIPFWFTVTITILLIWLYTFKGGIKTIVWTDTLQTLFMLIAVGVCIYTISDEMNISNIFSYVADNELSKTFFFEDYKTGNYFWKRFLLWSVYCHCNDWFRPRYDAKKSKLQKLKRCTKKYVLVYHSFGDCKFFLFSTGSFINRLCSAKWNRCS